VVELGRAATPRELQRIPGALHVGVPDLVAVAVLVPQRRGAVPRAGDRAQRRCGARRVGIQVTGHHVQPATVAVDEVLRVTVVLRGAAQRDDDPIGRRRRAVAHQQGHPLVGTGEQFEGQRRPEEPVAPVTRLPALNSVPPASVSTSSVSQRGGKGATRPVGTTPSIRR